MGETVWAASDEPLRNLQRGLHSYGLHSLVCVHKLCRRPKGLVLARVDTDRSVTAEYACKPFSNDQGFGPRIKTHVSQASLQILRVEK